MAREFLLAAAVPMLAATSSALPRLLSIFFQHSWRLTQSLCSNNLIC